MHKFYSERVELLKCEFYKLMGQLEVQKNIVVSDIELRIFEKTLTECGSDDEASAFILGSIRRYKIILATGNRKLMQFVFWNSFLHRFLQEENENDPRGQTTPIAKMSAELAVVDSEQGIDLVDDLQTTSVAEASAELVKPVEPSTSYLSTGKTGAI